MLASLTERVARCADFSEEERSLIADALANLPAAVRAAGAELHAKRNYMGRIEALYAALSLDEGGEGVCAAPLGNSGITATLVAADKIRFDKYLRPMAQRIAKLFGKPVRIAKFTRREDIEIFQP